VFVRYLHRLASEQARRPAPLSSAAILLLHDAVELFLQLSSEHLNVGTKRTEFMQYFELIDPEVAGQGLSLRESMRRLNNARIALKHHGTQPADQEVAAFATEVDQFLVRNMPLVFGVECASLSMSSLVAEVTVRACVQRADDQVGDGNLQGAMLSLSEAYSRLARCYDVTQHGLSALRDAAEEIAFGFERPRSIESFRRITDAIEHLAEEVALLRSGIDIRRLALFRALTPRVAITMSGSAHSSWFGRLPEPSSASVAFCYEFVIDSALRLQQLDGAHGEFGLDEFLRPKVAARDA